MREATDVLHSNRDLVHHWGEIQGESRLHAVAEAAVYLAKSQTQRPAPRGYPTTRSMQTSRTWTSVRSAVYRRALPAPTRARSQHLAAGVANARGCRQSARLASWSRLPTDFRLLATYQWRALPLRLSSSEIDTQCCNGMAACSSVELSFDEFASPLTAEWNFKNDSKSKIAHSKIQNIRKYLENMGKYGNFPEFFRIFSSSSLPPESSEPIQTAMSLFRRAIGPLARRLMPATRGDAYPQEYRTILFPTLPEHAGEVRHVFSRK
jgi:hypothetical protein